VLLLLLFFVVLVTVHFQLQLIQEEKFSLKTCSFINMTAFGSLPYVRILT
jgi:hypothetical protein